MAKVLIADQNYLSRVGAELLISSLKGYDLLPSVVSESEDLNKTIQFLKPDLLILDYYSLNISFIQLKALTSKFKNLKVLAITEPLGKAEMNNALKSGVNSHLLKECDREEIIEAIEATLNNERFLCGKIASLLTSAEEIVSNKALIKTFSCEGLSVTEREIEIIKYIAEGLSNKQIADKLNLSTHTVNTHRKNIMNKLEVNNTAGIVMYAVKNQLLETNHFLFSN
ncbi:MAG TPA: response regulator transcription factor [Bacteroidia bacterium]|nr:response regulator transcription factor [Bacteroidia bacterium]HRD40850.1 response regulator transcription factor [Bacteroidia bacterium]